MNTARADYEPSLGWTTDGAIQETSEQFCDLEAGAGLIGPQNRSAFAGPMVTTEASYRRFVHGLTPDQNAAMRSRMRQRDPFGSAGDVVLR